MLRFALRRRARVAIFAALGLVIASAGIALAATYKKGGAVSAVYTATDTEVVLRASSTPADIAGMEVTVTVPSGQRAMLIITFSAEDTCVNDQINYGDCLINVNVDGVQARPGVVRFDGSADYTSGISATAQTAEANSMQFVANPVAAGTHTVTVQYATTQNTTFSVGPRTLTVLRSKI